MACSQEVKCVNVPPHLRLDYYDDIHFHCATKDIRNANIEDIPSPLLSMLCVYLMQNELFVYPNNYDEVKCIRCFLIKDNGYMYHKRDLSLAITKTGHFHLKNDIHYSQ